MVTAVNYRRLANPWECFYSPSTGIGRGAVWAAWQSAAFRVIVSLGSSAEGQDRVPQLPGAGSSLFRLNSFSPGWFPKESSPELPHRGYSATSFWNWSRNRESRHWRDCRRHRGESDGRSGAGSLGFCISLGLSHLLLWSCFSLVSGCHRLK